MPAETTVMTDLKLYTNPQSRGRIARFMLEETGAPYERVVLSYGGSMKGADYLAINPMGKVPAIVHGDTIVTEGAAICAYLADAFPEAGLAPPAAERGPYYRWLFYGAGPLEAAVTARGLKLEPPADKAMQVGYGSVDLVFRTLEDALRDREWIASERFSAADVYVGCSLTYAMMFGILEGGPATRAYAQRVQSREAYVRANALDDADAARA